VRYLRIGDGGAHLHVWFFARPEGQAPLYGSWMVVWDDLLPEYPVGVADADAATDGIPAVRPVLGTAGLLAGNGHHRGPGAHLHRLVKPGCS
jgi:hypothetical protein